MKKLDLTMYKNEKKYLEYTNLPYTTNGNQFEFVTDDVINRLIRSENNLVYIRETTEYRFELILEPIIACTYLLKSQEYKLDLQVHDTEFENTKNRIVIAYSIETIDEKVKIEVNIKE